MKQLLAILLLTPLCGCANHRGEKASYRTPTMLEGFELAQRGKIEYITIQDLSGNVKSEFTVLGDSYARPLFDEFIEGFRKDPNQWSRLARNSPELRPLSNRFVSIKYRPTNLTEREKLIVPSFGFFIPKDEGQILSPKAITLLKGLELKSKSEPNHIYGKDE